MQNRIPADRLTRKFCEIVSAEWGTKDLIKRFLKAHPSFDINTVATETGMRPVHYALQAGTMICIKYLVEDLEANLATYTLLTNFMMISHRPEVKKYIASQKLWNKLGNGTTDLHGYAWAGDYNSLKAELEKNPDRISELNNDNRSIFSWAPLHIRERVCLLGQRYYETLGHDDHLKKRNYYLCIAYMEISLRKLDQAAVLFSHALKHHKQFTATTENDLDVESKIHRGLAEAYFYQLSITVVIKHKKSYSDKIKKCLDSLSSIPKKIPKDFSEYINYCAVLANTYSLFGVSLYQKGDGHIELGNYEKALSNYQHANDAFTCALKLVTDFPEYISAMAGSIEGAAEVIDRQITIITKETEILAPKLSFAESILGTPTIKQPANLFNIDEKAEEEEEDKEEDEIKIPNNNLSSPSSLHGGMYHSRPLYHSVSSSYATHPPPPPPDDKDIRALHRR